MRENGEEDFALPDGVTPVATCEKTGLLAGPYCPAVNDLFITGTEPHGYCSVHSPAALPEAEAPPTPEEGW